MDASGDKQPDRELLRIARVRTWEGDGATHARLGGASPVMALIITLVVEAVVLGFAYPVVAMAYNPQPVPLPLIVGVGAGAVAVAVIIAMRRYSRISGGRHDLVIRDDARTVTLPMNFGREYALELSFDEIDAIAPADEVPAEAGEMDSFERKKYEKQLIRPVDQLRPMGHRSEICYAVVLETRDGESGEARLLPIVRWTESARANAFALWLNHRLGREPKMVDFSTPAASAQQ